MKGVLLGGQPDAQIVDISHSIRPQNVREAAWILGDAVGAFPAGTHFVAVVDPGVGSDRQIVALRAEDHWFVAPDNGLLTRVADRAQEIFAITNSDIWRQPVSATFHGRDIMTPVAVYLSHQRPARDLGPKIADLQRLEFHEPESAANSLLGRIEYVDSFGNLISNIRAEHLSETPNAVWRVKFRGCELAINQCYAEGDSQSPIALVGSGGNLEVAIANGNAAHTLNCGVGSEIVCFLGGSSDVGPEGKKP